MSIRDWRQRLAIRSNQTVIKRLTNEFKKLGKRTLGIGAAAALEAAMTAPATKHDSSRAAANWDINIAGKNPYRRLNIQIAPKYYANHQEHGPREKRVYEIGKRGDKGKNAGNVRSRKRKRYGYLKGGKDGGGAKVKVAEGSWIFNNLEINKPGRKAVHLFNPIMGRIPDYAENAFPGYAEFRSNVLGRIIGSAKPDVFREVDRINAEIRRVRPAG